MMRQGFRLARVREYLPLTGLKPLSAKRGVSMTQSLLAIVVDCRDALSQARFWASVLGHGVSERNTGEFEVSHPEDLSTPLYFMNVPEPKSVKNRLHIDITTDRQLDEEVARLVKSGGALIEMRRDPSTLENPDTWVVMQDPEGNEFCVLNAGTVTGMA
jgi:predicted enzyme related to lactoylglutathione lyase